MTLQYISIEVEHPESIDRYSDAIQTAIAQYGSPIRWAITAVESNVFKVDAVVSDVFSVDSIQLPMNQPHQ
jgi:hypothetical protein